VHLPLLCAIKPPPCPATLLLLLLLSSLFCASSLWHTMALIHLTRALAVLPLAHAHMQMSSPSPLRDPHSDRDEPKDYNILDPLAKDGSNFPCKGYHLNTPLTPVATYEAGGTYRLSLSGSATHGGGSCQVSVSCNGGKEFRVINSMIGDCPLDKSYPFNVPEDLNCENALLAWTWYVRSL
jgi:hypothetical protein